MSHGIQMLSHTVIAKKWEIVAHFNTMGAQYPRRIWEQLHAKHILINP